MKYHNFSAGPAILPREVIEKSAEALLNFKNSGLSIMELSHRGSLLEDVFVDARNIVRELVGLDDSYEVIFTTGGASTQFFMLALNLLNNDETAGYVNTGTWATKAIEAAHMYGNIAELASSKNSNFSFIPKEYSIPSDLKYLHLTSNNTIYGTQLHGLPDTNVPIVCDMSSDFLSKPIDINRYGMIYAGAQKNVGSSGVTIVIIKKDMLDRVNREIPVMLDYKTFIENDSLYNTPPVFPIYVSLLTMQWIKNFGGLKAMETHNIKKGAILYDEIDRNSLFEGTVAVEDRSLMNICFVMKDKELEKEFMKYATDNGCMDMKGHRSVGGFRASTYNAMPLESIQFLADLMKNFENQYA
jgi:phosphoserine aminotransferase